MAAHKFELQALVAPRGKEINLFFGIFCPGQIFLTPSVTFSAKNGVLGGGMWDFWLKCSPSIADRSLKVADVSLPRKKIPLAETEANLGQNWQKSAIRVM